MKKGYLILLIICFGFEGNAQSKQVKLYLQQIAANKALIEYIQKGYKIARTGLTTIGHIRNGEFNLHRDFFGSLQLINPKIKNSTVVADLIGLQVIIGQVCSKQYGRIVNSNQFDGQEINYINSVFTRLLNHAARTLELAINILTAAHYQMSDDERIARLVALNADLRGQFAFVKQFGNNSLVLAGQRRNEKHEVKTVRDLHGIGRKK